MVAIGKALDHFIKEGGKSHKLAARLARLADSEGMRPQDVIRFPDLLEKIGLEPDDVSELTAHHASEMLSNHDEFVRQWVKDWNGVEDPKPEESKPVVEVQESTHTKRQKLWGYPVTAVIRWMGSEGFTWQEAANVLKKLGVDVADSTIQIQVRAGETGARGPAANLTPDQANKLHDLNSP